jgi:hypothetical protein
VQLLVRELGRHQQVGRHLEAALARAWTGDDLGVHVLDADRAHRQDAGERADDAFAVSTA